jgi:hypothetical protein
MITSANFLITTALTVAGLLASWCYGKKLLAGPAIATATSAAWLLYDLATGRLDLVLYAAISLLINARTLYLWRKR